MRITWRIWIVAGTLANCLVIAALLYAHDESRRAQMQIDTITYSLDYARAEDRFILAGDKRDTEISRRMLKSKELSLAKHLLHEDFSFDFDVRVISGTCPSGVSSHWDGDNRVILLCPGNDANIRHRADESDRVNVDATLFIAYHELGHAVIDDLDLPTLGREEDAADAFATIVAVREQRPEIAVAGARALEGADGDHMDVHSPGRTRAGLVRCLLYGADSKRFDRFASDAGLAESGRDDCRALWRKEVRAWSRLGHAPGLLKMLPKPTKST